MPNQNTPRQSVEDLKKARSEFANSWQQGKRTVFSLAKGVGNTLRSPFDFASECGFTGARVWTGCKITAAILAVGAAERKLDLSVGDIYDSAEGAGIGIYE